MSKATKTVLCKCGRKAQPNYRRCKDCHRTYARAYYWAHLDRQRELNRARAARHRARKKAALGGKDAT